MIQEAGIASHRAVLDCLSTQANPRRPSCAGCGHDRLCKKLREVLEMDYQVARKVASQLVNAGWK